MPIKRETAVHEWMRYVLTNDGCHDPRPADFVHLGVIVLFAPLWGPFALLGWLAWRIALAACPKR